MKLLDDQGREVPRGERGRIFTANSFVFEGYTDGGGKEVVAGPHTHRRRRATSTPRAASSSTAATTR